MKKIISTQTVELNIRFEQSAYTLVLSRDKYKDRYQGPFGAAKHEEPIQHDFKDTLAKEIFRKIEAKEVIDISNFSCPINAKFMIDPLLTSEGNTYEREAILQWLRNYNSVDPKTKKQVNITVRNQFLTHIVERLVEVLEVRALEGRILASTGKYNLADQIFSELKEPIEEVFPLGSSYRKKFLDGYHLVRESLKSNGITQKVTSQ